MEAQTAQTLKRKSGSTSENYLPLLQDWIDSDFDDFNDFDDGLDLTEVEFAKPLPPKPKKANGTSFRKPSEPQKTCKEVTNKYEQRPWIEKYAPKRSTDLAVNVKKVSEVRTWLEFNMKSGKKPGILLLLGPPGSGKTATIKCLAQDIHCHVQEWTSPNENVDYTDEMSEIPYVSQTKSFRNFMLRANKYASLGQAKSKILVLEELPHFIHKNLDEFHSILRSNFRLFPLVIIQSEEIRETFPADFIEELAIHVIHFNAITPTSLAKVLTSIAQAEKVPVPDKNVMSSLATSTNGDIRAAINAFQVGCATKEYRYIKTSLN